MDLPDDREALERIKLQSDIIKTRAAIEKLSGEVRKVRLEFYLYPFVVGSGVILAFVAVGRLFITI